MISGKRKRIIRLAGVVACIIITICILKFSERSIKLEDSHKLYYVDPSIEQIDGDLDFAAFTDPSVSEKAANAQEYKRTQDYEYRITDNEVIIIEGIDNQAGELVIPDTIDDYPVTSIGDFAFKSYTELIILELPNSLVKIGEGAFEGCTSLQKIIIPDNVALISDYAFYGCSALTTVQLPNGISKLGDNVFGACDLVEIKAAVGSVGEAYASTYDIPCIN